MNNKVFTILKILICLVILATPLGSARGQELGNKVIVLDRAGKQITSLTDGDTIRVRLELTARETKDTGVSFRLQGLDVEVAECTVQVGKSACESKPFESLGWFWDPGGQPKTARIIQARVNDTVIATSSEIQVASRPVVMVHGFSSNWEAWSHYLGPRGYLASVGLRGFAVGDGQAQGVMDTGDLTNPAGHTKTIAENALILGQYIKAVREQTGAQKIDLLVHSLGGLIARYYIDQLMPASEVVNLLILGSPMTGTGCANLPAALGFYLPAVLEFQPSYVQQIFNPQVTHRRGVTFSALAGVPLVDPIQSPCAPVPSDLAVSRDSVEGIPMDVTEMPILHTELNTSPEVFRQFVLPHLQALPGSFSTPPDPSIPASNAEPIQFTRLYTGHIDPGESPDLAINIEANITVASFALYDSTHSLAVQVTGASGKVITLDPVKNGLIEVKDPTSLVYLGYGFNNPKPGVWLVKLMTSDSTPPGGADYALTAVFQGGAALAVRTSVMTPPLNARVEFNADLDLDGIPLAINQAQATIRSAEGPAQTINMEQVPGSKGVHAYWTPTQPGLYGIEISVSGLSPDGSVVERTGFLSVEAQPGSQRMVMGIVIVVGGLVLLVLVVVGLIKLLRRRRSPLDQKIAIK